MQIIDTAVEKMFDIFMYFFKGIFRKKKQEQRLEEGGINRSEVKCHEEVASNKQSFQDVALSIHNKNRVGDVKKTHKFKVEDQSKKEDSDSVSFVPMQEMPKDYNKQFDLGESEEDTLRSPG